MGTLFNSILEEEPVVVTRKPELKEDIAGRYYSELPSTARVAEPGDITKFKPGYIFLVETRDGTQFYRHRITYDTRRNEILRYITTGQVYIEK
jgi:hypothetical protein